MKMLPVGGKEFGGKRPFNFILVSTAIIISRDYLDFSVSDAFKKMNLFLECSWNHEYFGSLAK